MAEFQYTSTTKAKINKKNLYKRWKKFLDIAIKICINSRCKDCQFMHIHKNQHICLLGLLNNAIKDINNKEQK